VSVESRLVYWRKKWKMLAVRYAQQAFDDKLIDDA